MSGQIGKAPEDLNELERAKWDELAKPSGWGKHLTVCDRDLLKQYCILAVRKAKADAQTVALGEVVNGGQGPKVSPWVQISDKCWSLMLQISDQLGGTPKSRARMEDTTPETPQVHGKKRGKPEADDDSEGMTLDQMTAAAMRDAAMRDAGLTGYN